METSFMVTRSDDNGHTFVIEDRLSEMEAVSLHKMMSARGHKQNYEIHSYSDKKERADLIKRYCIDQGL